MDNVVNQNPRSAIYYWKADRPAALSHANPVAIETMRPGLEGLLRAAVARHFARPITSLELANGQGNHITYRMTVGATGYFVRIEDGPEQDDYMEVESRVMAEVSSAGVPTPHVIHMDSRRREVPFAWQVLDSIQFPDLNQLHKQGLLDPEDLGMQIGASIGKWQGITASGFGPFRSDTLPGGQLRGYHSNYSDYFHLHLDRHLTYLDNARFITHAFAQEVRTEIGLHSSLLALDRGCLVHKDLALWNMMGAPRHVVSYIDWDDAIAGDPMDDISLLGCFHGGSFLKRVLAGYAEIKPLPQDFQSRFWLHLLRNMIVKAVIRVGSGYFDRTDSFFLLGAGTSGTEFKDFTLKRIHAALAGLRANTDITRL